MKQDLDPIYNTGEYLYWYFKKSKTLSLTATKEIFTNVTRDYLNGEVSTLHFSTVVHNLFYVFNDPYKTVRNRWDESFTQLLENSSKLDDLEQQGELDKLEKIKKDLKVYLNNK